MGHILDLYRVLTPPKSRSMAFDSTTKTLVIGHADSGVSLYSTNSNSVTETFSETEGLDSNTIRDIATRFGIAYIATEEAGVMRIDLSIPSIIGSWQSLGVDNLRLYSNCSRRGRDLSGITRFGNSNNR